MYITPQNVIMIIKDEIRYSILKYGYNGTDSCGGKTPLNKDIVLKIVKRKVEKELQKLNCFNSR